MTDDSGESRSGVALLLIDVINAFDFEGSSGLVAAAERVAPNIGRMARRAREANVPVIYVNDNFGRWRSDFRATIQACTAADKPGRNVSRELSPDERDYFVLKPVHSGFFSTTLGLLLDHLRADTLVIAGFAGNICVLFTANDAHMHGYYVFVPEDCCASNTPELNAMALTHVREVLGGDTRRSDDVDFTTIARGHRKNRGDAF